MPRIVKVKMLPDNKGRKIVIIGSGLSGLSTGYKLSREGCSVDIIENKDYTGGMSASIEKEGYIFDHGPHAFFTGNTSFYGLFKEVMDPDEYVVKKKDVRIKFNGKYYRYPLKSVDLLFKLCPWVSLACVCSYLITLIKNKILPSKNLSAEEWISNHFGRKLYNIYFGPYTCLLYTSPSPRDQA